MPKHQERDLRWHTACRVVEEAEELEAAVCFVGVLRTVAHVANRC